MCKFFGTLSPPFPHRMTAGEATVSPRTTASSLGQGVAADASEEDEDECRFYANRLYRAASDQSQEYHPLAGWRWCRHRHHQHHSQRVSLSVCVCVCAFLGADAPPKPSSAALKVCHSAKDAPVPSSPPRGLKPIHCRSQDSIVPMAGAARAEVGVRNGDADANADADADGSCICCAFFSPLPPLQTAPPNPKKPGHDLPFVNPRRCTVIVPTISCDESFPECLSSWLQSNPLEVGTAAGRVPIDHLREWIPTLLPDLVSAGHRRHGRGVRAAGPPAHS